MKVKYILFYKDLIQPGGAERLLLEVYKNLKLLDFEVTILTYDFNKKALFDYEISEEDLFVVPGKWQISKQFFLTSFLLKNRKSRFICDSGHINFYISSLLSCTSYSLHIHHPSFMTFNETDKYSIFATKTFKTLVNSNYGANEFEAIKSNLSIYEKIKINFKALFSILSIKKATNVFVLSKYAAKEKKYIYGVEAKVLIPGLDDSYFQHVVKKDSSYDNYKNVLLTLCRIDETKRLKELVDAFKIFSENNNDSILLIAGDGPFREELEVYTQEHNLNVKFLGFVEEGKLLDLYALAHLFISIDRADFRITALEANVVGTKALLSNETEPSEDLFSSGYLMTCIPEADSTAKAIENFIKQDTNISLSELHLILRKYTWQNYTKNLVREIELSK